MPHATNNSIPPAGTMNWASGLCRCSSGSGILNSQQASLPSLYTDNNIRILKPEIKSISGSTVSAQGHLHRLLVRLPEAVEGGAPTQLLQLQVYGLPMDQISIKTPNPKCRLYWCLIIEFIDWRYSQSCWYFRPLLWTSAHLTFSLVHLPPPLPPSCVNKYRGIYSV